MFDRFVGWARQAAIPLPNPLWATPELTGFLAGALARKRILFLGEADHFVREKIDYRLAFAEAALPAGFDWFGEELGWSDGLRIDDYLHGRQDASLERVTLFGHRGEARSDRDDSPTGILRASYEKPADEGLRFEHERLLRGLRDLARRSVKLRFFGFDVDGIPGGAYSDLAHLELPIERVPRETLSEEVERLTRFLEGRDDLDPLARVSLRTLRDSLEYTALAHPAPSYAALAPAMAYRERVMHRHVDFMLESLPPDHGLVLWGHNHHLARDDSSIVSSGGVGPGGDTEVSLGHHLNERHRDEIYVVWMIFGRGEDSQPLPGLSRKLRPSRRSLNALLRRVGGNFLLPTRSDARPARRLDRATRVYHLYNSHVSVPVAEQADAICFIDEVSPLRTNR